jgi:hypothetical protein
VLLVTDFVNIKIKPTQFFKYTYKDRMYVYAFISVSDICVYSVFLKTNHWCPRFGDTVWALNVSAEGLASLVFPHPKPNQTASNARSRRAPPWPRLPRGPCADGAVALCLFTVEDGDGVVAVGTARKFGCTQLTIHGATDAAARPLPPAAAKSTQAVHYSPRALRFRTC